MRFRSFPLLALALLPLSIFAEQPTAVPNRRGPSGVTRPMQAGLQHTPISAQAALTAELPPLPEGVEELKFSEFYKMPVGPRGLEPSERLLALGGKKVRLSGFFVFEDWGSCSCPEVPAGPVAPAAARRMRAQPAWMKHVVPGRIMLSPVPVTVSLGHYGLCDDLPPQVAYLDITSRFGEPVYYQPGIFAVTGVLKLGTKEQPDGRTSFVHLTVEKDADLQRLAARSAQSPALAPATQTTAPGAVAAQPTPAPVVAGSR